jgi:hypothetical protein
MPLSKRLYFSSAVTATTSSLERKLTSPQPDTPEAFIEPLGVGAELPDMPAWLDIDLYVNVPLESTYRVAWEACPADFRQHVEQGVLTDESLPEQAQRTPFTARAGLFRDERLVSMVS